MIDWLESMNPTDLDKRSDMTGVRCEMSTVDQRDDWVAGLAIDRCCHTER